MPKILGAHLSIGKGGLHKLGEQMRAINGQACALFLKNQRRYASTPLDESQVLKFRQQEPGVDTSRIVAHGSYLINLANESNLDKSYACFIDDLERCHRLGIKYYNFHPGYDTLGVGKSSALRLIAAQIDRAMLQVPQVCVLVENMSGQGSVCGSRFEELSELIDHVSDQSRVGVCLDTCHLFAAGYDIRTQDSFDSVMRQFDDIVGVRYLKAMHLNDSKSGLGSQKDRHESIGHGRIGLDAFRYIMNSEAYFNDIPMILETPNHLNYKREIQLLRSLEAQ
jgi:deoxyribonuclease-4